MGPAAKARQEVSDEKILASLAMSLFAFGLAPAGAQYQAPPPYNNQNAPSPYNNQNGAPPYNNQAAPPPYDTQAGQGSQDQSADSQPGVARVSFLQGDVSSQRGDSGDGSRLRLNAPISAGDRVATGANSRTEVQLDAADVLRLSDNTTANIVNLNRAAIQVQIGQGLASFSVVRGSKRIPKSILRTPRFIPTAPASSASW